MTAEVIVTIIAALAFAVGITGIVVPILPGSILIILGTLAWAIVVGGWGAWIPFALILVFSLLGITCSYVLTGRRLKQNEVPGWAIFVAVLGGVLGIFLLPGPGLILGFIAALFLVEYSRRKDPREAWASTWVALKALGIGILLELLLAMASATVFIVAAAFALFG
ncbi:MAG: DUF456 domain-containing protein [Dermabacter sp.]|nr:DUF456 domain-containing protein [Dermabacter sp.]